ncbi:MAG: glutamate--tRNA ligase [Alphaproteobacteria bacterium]|nr:glutamate--tRNA ligase [Alphaproteobacteria bacterium]
MTAVTRFAPSPTGLLHIGGARTALFNWLFARRYGGRFLLRIEDTDRRRSTEEAVAAILDGLAWLGLDPDEPPSYQFERRARHAEVANAMLEAGSAYRCYAGPKELEAMRTAATSRGERFRYDGLWRDRDPAEAPVGAAFAIRLKAPRAGETIIHDLVQGDVCVANTELDDMVLLRADGTPTYMLSVVVDDHDMGVTHVIRGDDHLNNAFRQALVFEAMDWPLPAFAHIPLIHGPDGAKLSKRHGALGVAAYREMGLLPEAVCNYLLRLGWSHGDAEIISTEEAITWFGLEAVGRSPARFDREKLESVNAHYLRAVDDDRLLALLEPFLARPPDEAGRARLRAGLPALRPRAKTLVEFAELAAFYAASRPVVPDAKAARLLDAKGARALLARYATALEDTAWAEAALEAATRAFATSEDIGLGRVAQPARAALTGRTASPGLFEVLAALGREEALGRLRDAADSLPTGPRRHIVPSGASERTKAR